MKKIVALLLTLLMVVSFAACDLDTHNTYSWNDSSETISSASSEISSETSSKVSSEAPETSNQSSNQGVGGTAALVNPSTIPAYSGKAYVAVNNNVPSFTSAELITTGYEKYSDLDSLSRCGVAFAICGTEIMPGEGEERGSISSIKPTGWVQAQYDCVSGKYLYNRCHLIGWQLSAENANKKNLITGTKYLNVEGMLPFENMVADYIHETGNHVAYRITPIFEGNNLLASGVQMEAYSVEDKGAGICFNIYCYNVQPGVKINYTTGASTGPSSSTSSTISSNTSPSTSTTTMVWISGSGTKYHSKSSCSNMKNPSQVTKAQAESQGRTPCKKCY